jgi:hypothetical protein
MHADAAASMAQRMAHSDGRMEGQVMGESCFITGAR